MHLDLVLEHHQGNDIAVNRWCMSNYVQVEVYPLQDIPGYYNPFSFGSAHASGLNFVLCDGSVQTVSYSIDTLVYQHLASRNDGQPVDTSQF